MLRRFFSLLELNLFLAGKRLSINIISDAQPHLVISRQSSRRTSIPHTQNPECETLASSISAWGAGTFLATQRRHPAADWPHRQATRTQALGGFCTSNIILQ